MVSNVVGAEILLITNIVRTVYETKQFRGTLKGMWLTAEILFIKLHHSGQIRRKSFCKLNLRKKCVTDHSRLVNML